MYILEKSFFKIRKNVKKVWRWTQTVFLQCSCSHILLLCCIIIHPRVDFLKRRTHVYVQLRTRHGTSKVSAILYHRKAFGCQLTSHSNGIMMAHQQLLQEVLECLNRLPHGVYAHFFWSTPKMFSLQHRHEFKHFYPWKSAPRLLYHPINGSMLILQNIIQRNRG